MTTHDIRIIAEDMREMMTIPQLAELCYYLCKFILLPIFELKISRRLKRVLKKTLRTVWFYFREISGTKIKYGLLAPEVKIESFTLICSNFHTNIEQLRLSLYEPTLCQLPKLHPCVRLALLDRFIKEAMEAIYRHPSNPSPNRDLLRLCHLKLRTLNLDLFRRLKETYGMSTTKEHRIGAALAKIHVPSK